jgi:hypothetical protein
LLRRKGLCAQKQESREKGIRQALILMTAALHRFQLAMLRRFNVLTPLVKQAYG